MRSLDWMADAVCAQTDPDLWFPEGSGNQGIAAKRICTACPVRRQCEEQIADLEGCGTAGGQYGVWGGLSARQRRKATPASAARDKAAKSTPQQPARRTRDRSPVVCGTRRGYQKHRRTGEPACDACRQANADADRSLRNTGTTKAHAA
ncbi:WhiB family transcriptional regulator [Streptomyces sp. NPDC052069]|uniref:WhiB family transcriptional regulator n=1 Tax=Streptomyces sp. NPDC052069 TaxID=3154650 RepID=UPI00341BFBD5